MSQPNWRGFSCHATGDVKWWHVRQSFTLGSRKERIMDHKTQLRAMELCVLIESELHAMSARSSTRPPELARVVTCLDELTMLIKALDRPPAGSQVSHLGSAVRRVVVQVSLELIKALADSQKYTQQPDYGAEKIGHGTPNAWHCPQETPWGERAISKEARSLTRGRSKLRLPSREWPSRAFCPTSSSTSNASRCSTGALARPCSLVRHARRRQGSV